MSLCDKFCNQSQKLKIEIKIYLRNKCNFKKKGKNFNCRFWFSSTKLIARRIRDLGVYSEIITPKSINKVKNFSEYKGIILSGGPSTVTKNFQSIPKFFFRKNSNTWYLLWITINCQTLWWKNYGFKKKKRVWKSLYI